MDDNSVKPDENQPQGTVFDSTSTPPPEKVNATPLKAEKPQPIFEAKPLTQESVTDTQPEDVIEPEEVAPEVITPDQALNSAPPPKPPNVPNPLMSTGSLKYFIIGGGAALFLFFLFLIFSFFFSGAQKKETITLNYWGLWEDKQIYEPLIAQYESKNPNIKINYEKMAPDSYREKVIARSKVGTGPDIFRFHNTWLPEMQEVVSALPSSIIGSREFESTFYPIMAKDLKVKNRYFGIPLYIDGLVLVYNNGLFKKAGLNKAPVTWNDISDYIEKLYSGQDKTGQLLSSSIAIGTANNIEHFSEIFGLMLVQNGGDLHKLDQAEASGALESYRKFAEPPHVYWNENMPNAVTAFAQEKVAMILVPSWEIIPIKIANPDIDLKVTTVPRLPGGNPISIASYWVEGVSINSKHQIEAWKFLKFLSEKENMAKMNEAQSKVRIFGNAYSRMDMASTLSQNPYTGPIIEEAKYFVSLPLVARTYDNGINDTIVSYLEKAITQASQGVSYTESLRVASDGVNQVFKSNKIEQ